MEETQKEGLMMIIIIIIVLPWQDFSVRMPERPGVLEIQTFDPLDQTLGSLLRSHIAFESDHPRLDSPWMQDRDRDLPLLLQIHSKSFPEHVQGSLARTVTVPTTGTVVLDRTHSAGDEGDLASLVQVREEGLGDTERCESIHFELELHRLEIQVLEILDFQDSSVVDQDLEFPISDLVLELSDGFRFRDIDPRDDLQLLLLLTELL